MLFLFTVLFASLSLSSASLPAIMRDPKQFIQSLDTINPVVVKKMITMVNQLITDGELERQGHHDRQERAQNRYDAATEALEIATNARNDAAGKVKNQEGVVKAARSAEESAKDNRDDRKRELELADSDATAKKNFRISEVKRIDAEKDLLQQIVKKLETLLPGVELIEGRLTVTDYIVGRNLLSSSNADRDAVQRVVDKVNAMVGSGEAQRSAVTKADDEAQAALVDAQIKHSEAVKVYEAAAKVLATAEGELDSLEKKLDLAEIKLNDATTEFNSAKDHLGKMTQVRVQEDKRLDSERATCEEILELLNGFLTEE